MIRLADIAKDMNVSTATVSNALSGKGRMSDETRRAIIRRANQLGYKAAEGSKRSQRKAIGVIAEQIGLFFCDAIVDGVCQEAQAGNIVATIYNLGVLSRNMSAAPPVGDLAALLHATLDVIDTNLAGIIYVSQNPRDVTGLVKQVDYPIVLAYCATADHCCTVNYDDRQGAHSAVSELLRSGRHRIAMISGPIDSIAMSYRTIGYQRALIDGGLPFDPQLIRIGDWMMDSGYTVMQDLLAQREIPDAVFSQNDFMAFGAIHAILDRGLRIPEDIAVIGFDNSPMTRFSRPSLSSVDPGFIQLGRQAVRQLMKIVQKDGRAEDRLYLPCSVVHRGTTLP